MGQALHGCATTTEAIRRALQRSEASVRVLARRHGISATTVQKWRKRETAGDARMAPDPHGAQADQLIRAHRRTGSHDRCLHEKATRQIAADVVHALVEAVPYKIHSLLTDNGVQFAHAGPEDCSGEDTPASWTARQQACTGRCHALGCACEKHGIEHRLATPCHPWTNGQVQRMSRTLKDATVRRCHHASHDDLRRHVQLFLDAHDHARRLKALRGLTPYEFTCQTWIREPDRFRADPSHNTPGLNS